MDGVWLEGELFLLGSVKDSKVQGGTVSALSVTGYSLLQQNKAGS